MDGGASHFSMVGYDLDASSIEAFQTELVEITDRCEIVVLDDRHTLCRIADAQGGEIYLGLVSDGPGFSLHTANPAFTGSSRMPVRYQATVSEAQWEPFEYALSVTVSDLDIPVLIDLADPREIGEFTEGQALMLDVTAFTYNPQLYVDENAYYEAQKEGGEETVFASNHFIPSGLFGEKPQAYAMFAGEILQAELKTTSMGTSYWTTLVKTLDDVTINVVFDDISTKEPPQVGQLLAGEFWLSAHIVEAQNQ